MLIPAGTQVWLVVFFEDADGLGLTGLTPTVDAWELQADETKTEQVTAGSMIELGDGLYYYKHTMVNTAAIFAVAKDGSATAARQNVPCTALPGDMMTTLDTRSTFDPATDTVANVTTVGSVTATVSADVVSVNGTAVSGPGDLKADVSGLSTFDPLADHVTVGTNNDKTGYSLTADYDAAKTPDGIRKNLALSGFTFQMFDENGDPATGLTVSAERSIDGGAYGGCANSVTEVGSGTYSIDLAAADTNGDFITYKFSASGAQTTFVSVRTVA